jgi:hypothetical protein
LPAKFALLRRLKSIQGIDTINISTTSAFVAAACGVKVCKHGSRSVSSQSGSSDLLAAFGINLYMSPLRARQCLDDLNICFIFAPYYHEGMRFAAPVRAALQTRSIFNILGPLVNPARPNFELMGVYSPELIVPLAKVHQQLGMKRVMVVHGSGLDEIALHGETQVAESGALPFKTSSALVFIAIAFCWAGVPLPCKICSIMILFSVLLPPRIASIGAAFTPKSATDNVYFLMSLLISSATCVSPHLILKQGQP